MAGNSARRLAGIAALCASLLAADRLAAETAPNITVTAFRRPVTIERAGSTVTVISRKEIEQASAGSTADLLRRVPGVTVSEAGGAGGEALIRLRGAEAQHTLVLIDGIRVNDPASRRNQFDFALIAPTDIERIEILRGPQSALYGADAIGGVINIITRRPTGKTEGRLTVEGGSYGTHRETVSLSGGIGGLNLLASGTYFHSDGFSRVGDPDDGEADATEKLAGTLRGRADLGGGRQLQFGLDGFHQDSEIDKSTADNPIDRARRDMVDGYARFTVPGADGVDHAFTGFFTHTTRFYVEDSSSGPRYYDYRGDSIGAEYQADIDLKTHGTLVAGASIEQVSAYQKRQDQPAPAFDDQSVYFAGFLLHSFTVLDHLHLSVGGRYDGAVDGDGFLTGRVTAAYENVATETRWHASFGSGAKRPSAFQLSYNPDLRTERSVGGDIGVDQTLHEGRLLLSATAFYNRIDDMIDFTGGFISGTYENIAAAETGGLELSAEAVLIPGELSASASYTYLFTRNLENGLPLPRRPEHSGRVALTWTGHDRLEVTASALLVGPRFDDDAATERLPGYVRVDLNASYRMKPNLTLFGRVENLFDADYHEIGDYNVPGLSAYVGLTWQH